MKFKYIASSSNGAAVLYFESIMPDHPGALWKWTPDRKKARRFATQSTAAKYGAVERVRAK